LQIDAYPNPTFNKWNIMFYNFASIKYANLKLMDMNGKVVWSLVKKEFSNSNIEVPASNLSNGIYCLNVITDSQVTNIKLVKE
jgi:Secretion system C-terminal sorting domain